LKSNKSIPKFQVRTKTPEPTKKSKFLTPKPQAQIYETHQSLAYKWVQGYLNDKQLIDQSYKLLDEYVKKADGETIFMDQAEL